MPRRKAAPKPDFDQRFSVEDPRVVAWLSDLVTTTAKQGRKQLKRGDRYCCLGRLCEVLDPERKSNWYDEGGYPPDTVLPSLVAMPTNVLGTMFADHAWGPAVFAIANDKHRLSFSDIALLACFIDVLIGEHEAGTLDEALGVAK